MTALMHAIYHGYDDLAELLISHTCVVGLNCRNRYGRNALMIAIDQGRLGVANSLISLGVDVHLEEYSG